MKLYNDKKELKNAIIHVSLAIFVICWFIEPAIAVLMALVFVFGGLFVFGVIGPFILLITGRGKEYRLLGKRDK